MSFIIISSLMLLEIASPIHNYNLPITNNVKCLLHILLLPSVTMTTTDADEDLSVPLQHCSLHADFSTE